MGFRQVRMSRRRCVAQTLLSGEKVHKLRRVVVRPKNAGTAGKLPEPMIRASDDLAYAGN